MVANNVAVVIPHPTINPDEYKPFDYDLYRSTVEDVLSDESRFASSFDEYSSGHADDTGNEHHGERELVRGKRLESEKQQDAEGKEQAQTRARLSGKKKSPYFPTGRAKKTAVTQRQITRIDNESESEPEPELESVPEFVAAPADENDLDMSLEAAMPLYDGGDEAEVEIERETVPEQEREEEDALGRFLLEHPFMKEGGYPVGRHARRQFISQLCEEAGKFGMDADAVNVLVKNVKTAYLETWAVGHTIQNNDPDGSEFGDEFDDMGRKHKKRKRKRHDDTGESNKHPKDKGQGRDKTSGSEADFLPVRLKPGPVDIDQTMDALLQSLPDASNHDTTAAVDNPGSINGADDFSVELDPTPENTERSGTSDLQSITNSQNFHGNASIQVDSGLRAHPVSLNSHDDKTSTAKENKRAATAESANRNKNNNNKKKNKKQVGTNDVDKPELDKESGLEKNSAKRTERRRRRRQHAKEKKRKGRESAINRNSASTPVSGKQPENLHQDFY